MSTAAPAQPPARQIRLLANVAPGAGVVFALLAGWLAVSTVGNFSQLVTTPARSGQAVLAAVLFVVLDAAAAVVTALIAYRLLVEVPRTVRGWEAALAERSQALRSS